MPKNKVKKGFDPNSIAIPKAFLKVNSTKLFFNEKEFSELESILLKKM